MCATRARAVLCLLRAARLLACLLATGYCLGATILRILWGTLARKPSPLRYRDQNNLRSQIITAVAVISNPEFGVNETYKVLYAIFITTSILTSVPALCYRLHNAWALRRAIQKTDGSSPTGTSDTPVGSGSGSPPFAPRGGRRRSLQGVEFGTRVLLDRYNWELSQIHRALIASQLTVMTLLAEDVPMCDPAASCRACS